MHVTLSTRWQTLHTLVLRNRTGGEFQSVYPISGHRDELEEVRFRFADAKSNIPAIGQLGQVTDAKSNLRATSV